MQDDMLCYMQQALALAERGRLSVSPNPMVGCIIVKNGHIIGQGYHQQAGDAHAEIIALQAAGEAAHGATAYVTLEPCAHHGKTPPCTDALIAAGINDIVVATQDPNPLVSGKGIATLQAHGITVTTGILKAEATQLNEIFFHYMRYHRPFVIAKWAMSLDGKTVTAEHDDKRISSTASEHSVHALRQQVDAVLIGAETARHDDPLLTVRHVSPGCIGKQPIRIVLSSQGNLPVTLKLFDQAMPSQTIVVVANTAASPTLPKHIEILRLPTNIEGLIDLPSLLQTLGARGITSLLVEGGMATHHHFFREQLVNKVCVYLAPVIIGSLDKKHWLPTLTLDRLAHDYVFTGRKEEIPCV